MPTRDNIHQNVKDLIQRVSESNAALLTYPLLVEFFDGDHNAAIMLNQILYWTERTSHPDGWFYKTYDQWRKELQFSAYQIRRVVCGDERVQEPKRNLTDVGLETKVKMAPNGRNATFYKLDVAVFVAMLVEWIEERFGMAIDQIQRQMKPSTPKKKPRKQTSDKQSFSLFGVDLSAWTNGGRIERPSKPTATPTERVETIYRDNQSAAEMWRIAHHQLEVQFDRATFETYIREVVLVDYDVDSLTFTLAAERPHQVEMLQYRLLRNVRRVLSDVCGDEVTVQFVTFDDWEHRLR